MNENWMDQEYVTFGVNRNLCRALRKSPEECSSQLFASEARNHAQLYFVFLCSFCC